MAALLAGAEAVLGCRGSTRAASADFFSGLGAVSEGGTTGWVVALLLAALGGSATRAEVVGPFALLLEPR